MQHADNTQAVALRRIRSPDVKLTTARVHGGSDAKALISTTGEKNPAKIHILEAETLEFWA